MEHHRHNCLFDFGQYHLCVWAGVWLVGTRADFVRAVCVCVFCQFCGGQTQII